MSTKPVIYIVPGAWLLPTVWSTFVTTAKEAGYPVVFNQLPTVGGTEVPLAALSDDVAVVQNNLQKLVNEESKEVILVGHSSGGLVASCAAERFDAASRRKEGKKGGVIQVAFLAAFAVREGEMMLEILTEEKRDWFYMGDEGDRTYLHEESAIDALLNDLPAEEQKYWGKQVAHTSMGLFNTPSTFEPWNNGIPCSYIYCERDQAIYMPRQKMLRDRLGPDAKEVYLDCGHCPFLSMPKELLRAVEELLA